MIYTFDWHEKQGELTVCFLQSGFEQIYPTRLAKVSLVLGLKSSRLLRGMCQFNISANGLAVT
jgi:hypothetical protein